MIVPLWQDTFSSEILICQNEKGLLKKHCLVSCQLAWESGFYCSWDSAVCGSHVHLQNLSSRYGSGVFGKASESGQRSVWDEAFEVIRFLSGFLPSGSELILGWAARMRVTLDLMTSRFSNICNPTPISGLVAGLLLLLPPSRYGE